MSSLQIPLPEKNVVDDGSSSDESTDDDTTNEICVFLRKMLCINPNLRSTTNELLKDNFLKPIKEI